MTDRNCSVEDCDSNARTRGWCNSHYARWRRYGDPLGEQQKRTPIPMEEAFWSSVEKTDHCWNWTGGRSGSGYGVFRRKYVHRIAYQMANGELPDLIDHICHNPLCVNSQHLRPATRKQNAENLSGAHQNSVSGIRGVSWSKQKNKWRVDVSHKGHRYYGLFDNLADAESRAIAKRNELFTHNDLDRTA